MPSKEKKKKNNCMRCSGRNTGLVLGTVEISQFKYTI